MNSLKAFWMRRFLLLHKIWEAGGGDNFPLAPCPPTVPTTLSSWVLPAGFTSQFVNKRANVTHWWDKKEKKREEKNMENTFSDCEVIWNMKIRVRKNIVGLKKQLLFFSSYGMIFWGGWFNLADTICCFINKLYPTNHSHIMSQTIINVGLARKDWNE